MVTTANQMCHICPFIVGELQQLDYNLQSAMCKFALLTIWNVNSLIEDPKERVCVMHCLHHNQVAKFREDAQGEGNSCWMFLSCANQDWRRARQDLRIVDS
eukprot:scpid101328/ scgid27323/ 